jgi:hypothetical protein
MTVTVYVNNQFAKSFITVVQAKKFINDHDKLMHSGIIDYESDQSFEYQIVESD